MTARQVLEHVWLVGSGTDRDAFTDRHDCHCYLVWDGTSGFLIDAGTGLGADRWLQNIREVCDPTRLEAVLLTHYHADHAGGAAMARAAGIDVRAHETTVDALRHGDEERTQMRRAREAGIYPPEYRLRRSEATQLEVGGSVVSGDMSIKIIDAPGHCDGHLVFMTQLATGLLLFSGDCLFADSRVSMQPIPDCHLDKYAATVIRVAAYRPDALLPGHGDLVLSNAWETIDRAADAFQRLIPPPNLMLPW